MVRLILARHAESEMNKLGIHQGQLHDTGLSPLGLEQAKALAKKLKFESIDEIYCSDMKRAFETSKAISQELGGIEIKKDKRLREFTMGDFDKSPKTRDKLFEKYYKEEFAKGKSKYEIRPPNGENIWDFIKRIMSFLEEIKDKDATIAVVSHGGSNEVIFNIAQNLEKDDFKRYYQANACINELIYKNGKWTILSVNKTSHLNKMPKPKKEIYPDQDILKKSIVENFSKKLKDAEVSKAYLFGSLLRKEFGKYSEEYGRHKGSNINVLVYLGEKGIPHKWKYIDREEGFWEIYEAGKYELNGLKHKLDVFVVLHKEDQELDKKIIEICGPVEKII